MVARWHAVVNRDRSSLCDPEARWQAVFVSVIRHLPTNRRIAAAHRRPSLVRRDLRFSLASRGLDGAMRSFCRKHGLVDPETGREHSAEASRVLLYAALMGRRPDLAVEGAVRAAKVMLIGSTFMRLQILFATSDQRPRGGPRSYDRQAMIHVTLDDWLHQAASQYSRNYARPDGAVDDLALVTDLLRSGWSNPNIDRIAQEYTRRMVPIREAIKKVEVYARTMLVHAVGKERPIEELLQRGAAG